MSEELRLEGAGLMPPRDTLHLIVRLSGWIAHPDLEPTLVSDIRAARDAISRMAEILDEMAGEMRKAQGTPG